MSATEILRTFGRYFLLDKIAHGGMTEIYRARLASKDGASRVIVIKALVSDFAGDIHFKKMFQNETKIMMGLNHPNLAQLFDYGEDHQQPYIAMEYVDGCTLKDFQAKYIQAAQIMPVEVALYIAGQVCSGLAYAHGFRDRITDTPLNIIHRDINPQNILLSFEGAVKIIDFGIVKSAFSRDRTQTGLIKGKPDYLSPEQICGADLDLRSDIFSLGTVLWELLTGKRLFFAENLQSTLIKIETSDRHIPPPSLHNPLVTLDLDRITLAALANNREHRFRDCDDFQRAIQRSLYTYDPDFNPQDLTKILRSLYKKEIDENQKTLRRLCHEAEDHLNHNSMNIVLNQVPPLVGDETTKPLALDDDIPPLADHTPALPVDSLTPTPTPALVLATPPPQTDSEPMPPPLSSAPPPSPPAPPPAAATGVLIQFYRFGAHWKAIGVATLLIFAFVLYGFLGPQRQKTGESTVVAEFLPASTPSFVPLTTASSVSLKLHITPENVDSVSINDTPLSPSMPTSVQALDVPLEIKIQKEGFRPYKRLVVLDSKILKQSKDWSLFINLAAQEHGFLNLKTTPWTAKAVLFSKGQEIHLETPISRYELPVGNYKIRLTHELLGITKDISVTINANRTKTLEVEMALGNQ